MMIYENLWTSQLTVGTESVLLLAAQIEVIVHIIRWINMVFKYFVHKEYIYKKLHLNKT